MKQDTLQVQLFADETPPNSTIFVLGATGCGKTTLIANMLLERERFIIVDTREEYPPSFFSTRPGEVIVVSDLHHLVAALNNGTPRIIIRVDGELFTDHFLNLACFQLINFQRANKGTTVTLAMDELNRFVTSQSCPAGLRELIQRGRAHGVQKIFGAQWFNAIPTWCRDSFSEIYAFRHSEPRGLSMLECYGIDSHVVKTLPPHTCVRLAGGTITTLHLKPYGKK